jgi:predicted nuclease of predicted toxin-antitoxin system
MKVLLQADADLNEDIVAGVIRREPHIDFQTAAEANLRGLSDQDVLTFAARENRILVTHDRRTMPAHFANLILSNNSPGVFIVGQNLSVRIAIEELVLIWTASDSEEWTNLIVELPL